MRPRLSSRSAHVKGDWSRERIGYPDPDVEVLDPRFEKYRLLSATIERLWTGGRWTEGPVWFGDARSLYFSDIPNDRMLCWSEATGTVSVYRTPPRARMAIPATARVD
jgi:gluconolactonase